MTVQMLGPGEFGAVGITAAMAGPLATVAGAPYSAEAVTQRVQVLGDGNRILQSTSASVARDGHGRVRRDESLPPLGVSGETPHLVMIDDPVGGIHWTLDAETKTAVKMPFGQMKTTTLGALPPPQPGVKTWFQSGDAPPPPPPPAPNEAPNVRYMIRTKEAETEANVSKTDLGMQTVEGVPAQGTRTTRTIPAGAVGNEQPITITTETWYSPDLKILISSKSSDPRMGETSYKLTNIQRSEPAASLFQVPEDYTVKDQPSNLLIYHDMKLKDEKGLVLK